MVHAAAGRVIVTGMGKSGHVGRKVAATLASTGQPAMFVHPAEASHGDLGMLQSSDVVLALSWSGETAELADIITYAKRFAIPLIAMTSRPESTLGRAADVVLVLPAAQEACPNGLAPTTSTTMQLVLGDALAIALLESQGFFRARLRRLASGRQARREAYLCPRHHAHRRPGAAHHGRRKNGRGDRRNKFKGFGCVGVFEQAGALVGHHHRRRSAPPFAATPAVDTPVEKVMTRTPRTIAPDALVAEALELISQKISALLVVERGEVVGIVHFHDLMRLGAV